MLYTYQRYSNLSQARKTSEQHLPHAAQARSKQAMTHAQESKLGLWCSNVDNPMVIYVITQTPLETTHDARAREQIGFISRIPRTIARSEELAREFRFTVHLHHSVSAATQNSVYVT